MIAIVLITAFIALVFSFTNGMNDAANCIATAVATKAMPPKVAVAWAACWIMAAIFVFPMTVAATMGKGIVAGLQNKLLEAMATQLPCVTSPLAGKPLKGITDQHDILICDKVEEYVEAITQLLTDNGYYQQISQQGYQYVQQRYSWEAATEPLLQLTIDS